MKTLIFLILLMVLSNTETKAQTVFQSGLVKSELLGSDTVSTVRDTLSRKYSSTSNTLKDLFKTSYQVLYITSANKLSISSDPTFPAAGTFTSDSLSNYYNHPVFITSWRSLISFPNIYIKATSGGTATYYYRLEGY